MDKNELYKNAASRMDKTISAFHHELQKVRTGRATPTLLDSVTVDYYGNMVPINQVANLSVPEPRLIVVQPWEKQMVGAIEKAILKAELGLNPSSDGTIIRIPIPQLSEERRRDLVKLVKKFAEESRIAIRNIRRDTNDHLKKLEKNHDVSEDELSVELEKVQNVTDKHIKEIDRVLAEKEKEVLEI